MTEDKGILYCHCAYARIIPPEVKTRVLADLLSSGAPFEAVPVSDVWARAFTTPPPEGCGVTLSLRPDRDGTDGFFCALFQRKEGSADKPEDDV